MSIASNNAFMFLLHVFKQYSNNPLAVSWTACRESFKAVGLDWCSTYHCNTTTASFLTFQPRWHLCLESRPLSLYLSRFVFYKGSVLERVCIFTTLYRTGRMHTSWITQLITCRLFVWMAWTGYNCAQGSHPGLHNLCRSASVTQDYTVCAGQPWSLRTTQSVPVSLGHSGLHSLCWSASVTQDYTVCAGQPRSLRTTQSVLVSLGHSGQAKMSSGLKSQKTCSGGVTMISATPVKSNCFEWFPAGCSTNC